MTDDNSCRTASQPEEFRMETVACQGLSFDIVENPDVDLKTRLWLLNKHKELGPQSANKIRQCKNNV